MKLFYPFFLLPYFVSAQVWLQLTDFPATKRDDGVAIVVNDKAYFGTGLQEWTATIDFYSLDLQSFNWQSIPNMPNTTERQYACSFSGENCFYVFGGDGGSGALNDLYKFDIINSSWKAMGSKPGLGLVGACSMRFGDKVIIASGKSQMGIVDTTVWEYTLSTDTWLQKNPLPFPGRWRSSATVFNNKGYFLFGIDGENNYRNEFYSYDPSTDQWTKLMNLPFTVGRAYASLNVANSKLILFGGRDSLGNYYKDLWYFNTVTNAWIQGPDLPALERKGGMSVGYGESVIYSCGITASDQRLTETWMTHVPTGIKDSKLDLKFSCFPNPVTDDLSLEFKFPSTNTSTFMFRLRTIYGIEIMPKQVLSADKKISLMLVPSGLYILDLYSEGNLVGTIKVIKN